MNRCLTGLIVVMLTVLWIAPISAQKNSQAEAMLATAKQKETVEGDLSGAIKQYKEIVAKYAKTDRATAAMALIRMADAYQRMGDRESRRIYEQVVKDYPDQKEAVTLARAGMGLDTSAGPVSRTVWTSNSILDKNWSRLSPDGRFLSFSSSRNEDIFLREISTSVDRNLTNQPKDSKDYAFESVFSPDGKRIAYLWKKDKQPYTLWVVNLSASPNPRQLYDNPDLDAYDFFLHDWSREGKLAVTVYKNDKTVQIGWVSVSDGSLHVLKTTDWDSVGTVRFSPDGKYLGYDRSQSDYRKANDVFVLSVDGSGEIPAVEQSNANDVFVGWSPDQKWLLFTSDRFGSTDLWTVAFSEGKTQGMPQRLRSNIGRNFRPLGWTPDGALYYKTNSFMMEQVSNVQLASLDISTGKFLSTAMASRNYQEKTSSPAWSLDGKRLAYLSALRDDNKLIIRAIDTGTIRELRPRQLSGLSRIVAWASDGRSLLVSTSDPGDRAGIYRVNAETGDAVAVVLNKPGISYSGITWMPDGLSYLTYASGENGGLFRIDTQTGASTLVFKQETAPGALFPAPDGKTLYYTQAFPRKNDSGANAGTDYAFILRDLATGNERELIRRNRPLKPSFSPDRQYAAITSSDAASNSFVLLLFPTTGGTTPRELLRIPSEGKTSVAVIGWLQDANAVLVRQDPSDRTRETELWLVPLNEGTPKRLIGDSSIPANSEISMSSDGRYFAYTITEPAPPLTSEVAVLENFLPKTGQKK